MPTCPAGTAGTWWSSSRRRRHSPRAMHSSGSWQFAYGLTALFLLGVAWLGMHELRGARRSLARHAERLRMLHEIDRAVLAEETPGADRRGGGAAAARAARRAARHRQPLRPRRRRGGVDRGRGPAARAHRPGRALLDPPDGRRRSAAPRRDPDRRCPGACRRARKPPRCSLPACASTWWCRCSPAASCSARSASAARRAHFPKEQINIVREVAAQLAIAITQANLLSRVKDHAAELESRVRARTAELDMLHSTTLEISKAPDSNRGIHAAAAQGVRIRRLVLRPDLAPARRHLTAQARRRVVQPGTRGSTSSARKTSAWRSRRKAGRWSAPGATASRVEWDLRPAQAVRAAADARGGIQVLDRLSGDRRGRSDRGDRVLRHRAASARRAHACS